MESLACLNDKCEDYEKSGLENLTIRKVYGKYQIRYLRCKSCGKEFSERKGTAQWNSKISPKKFEEVAEHIVEGNTVSSIVRLCKVHHETVERLIDVAGEHSQEIHDKCAVDLELTALQSDERYGFVENKKKQYWEATSVAPESKFLVSLRLGRRDDELIRELLEDSHKRLSNPQNLVLLTDGGHGYATHFPEIFGESVKPKHTGCRGRPKATQYRIPRTLAHVQIIKNRKGHRLESVDIRYTHGTKVRVQRELEKLNHTVPNTSAVERQNGTARQHNAFMKRKGLAFAKKASIRDGIAEIGRLNYNWVAEHRSLKLLLDKPIGRKKYHHRTPAMAIGISHKSFALADLLATPVHVLTVAR